MEESLRGSWLAAEFITYYHRITGRVDVRQLKLADQLNSRASSFLRLEDAYVSNIERPAEIIAGYQDAFLRKDHIVAAIVTRQEDALPRDRSYGTYLAPALVPVLMTVATFAIRGYMYLSGKMDLRVVLTTGTDDFVTVLDGEMISAVRKEITFQSKAMLVNKAQIEVFWVEEEGQASHGANPGH